MQNKGFFVLFFLLVLAGCKNANIDAMFLNLDSSSFQVTGISDISSAKSQTWNWSCSGDLPCTYAFKIDQNSNGNGSLDGETFSSINTASIDSSRSDGIYYLHVQAKNSNEEITEIKTVQVTLDNSAPIITASNLSLININNSTSFPISGSCNEGHIYLSGPYSSASACTSAPCSNEIRIDCSSSRTWSTSVDASMASDGTVYYSFYSKDDLGNQTSISTISYSKDTTAPTLSLNPPPNSGIINSSNASSYTISGNCSESNKTISVTNTFSREIVCTSGSFSTNFDFSSKSDGYYTLSFIHTDDSGNSVSSSITLTKSSSPINGTISINNNDAVTNSTSVTLSLNSSDASEMYITNNSDCSTGGTWETFTTSKSWSISNQNATNNIYVKYKNSSGNNSSCLSDSIVHDNISPLVSMITPPAFVNNNNKLNFPSSGTCSIGDGNVNLTFSGTVTSGGTTTASSIHATTACTSGTFNIYKDISSLNDGAITIMASQTDAAGNIGNASSRSVNKDTQDPSLSISSLSHSNYVNLNNVTNFAISGTCSENGQNVSFSSGAFSDSSICTSNSFSKVLNLSTLSDGSLPITISISDTASNLFSTSISLIKNTNSVSGTILINSNSAQTNNTSVLLTLNSNAATYMYITNNPDCSTGGTWEAFSSSKSWTISTQNSENFVYAKFKNSYGNMSGCLSDSIVHDNSPPNITIDTLPAYANASTIGTFSITGSCSVNDGLVTLVVSDNTTSLSTTHECISGRYSTSQNLNSLSEGTFTVNSTQTDAAGNSGIAISKTAIKDTVAPIISLNTTNQVIRAFNKTNFPINGNCTTSDLDVNLTISGTSPTGNITLSDSISCLNSQFNFSKDLSGYIEGIDIISVTTSQFDTAGNSASTTMTLSKKSAPISVTAGNYNTCEISNDGNLFCWGKNDGGQIGDGTATNKSEPTLIDSPLTYKEISLHEKSTCGITSGHVLKCWGDNFYGQLGIGTSGSGTSTSSPSIVDSGTSYNLITTGYYHTCGITIDGTLKCWGFNSNGQVDNSNQNNVNSPTIIDNNINYKYSFATAGGAHTCAITNSTNESYNNILKCWGSNSNGQVGNGSWISANEPQQIDPGVKYSKVATGYSHTCGVTMSSDLKCWGYNYYGQLGNNSTTVSLTPVYVGSNFLSVSTGGLHTCGITTDHELKCWGYNYSGQLGLSSGVGTSNLTKIPTIVNSGTKYLKVFAGDNHTCAITLTGVMQCWGDNSYKQVNSSATMSSYLATIISPL